MLIAALLAACTGGSTGGDSGVPSSSGPQSSSTSASPTAQNTAKLHVREWGATTDGLLSVVVKNVGTVSIQRARAIITAKDSYDNTVVAVSAPTGARCCTIVGLAPGQVYGLYSNVGTSAGRIHNVEVEYTDVQLSKAAVPTPSVATKAASLRVSAKSATVQVPVTVSGKVGPYISAQAFLAGPDGKFIAVVSGGYYCLPPNKQRTIRLQFFHPLPAQSRVRSIVAYPLDAATARAEKLPSCTRG